MESEEGTVRSRKQALKPIETKYRRGSKQYVDKGMMMEEEEPVSPAGRFFNEPNFKLHIISIMGCKTRISPDVAKERLPNTLLKHPRFSSLLVIIMY